MKNQKKSIYVIVSLVLLPLLFFSVQSVRADSSIPDNFNKNLDLDQVYIYTVNAFNTTKSLEWKNFNWLTTGHLNTTPGGQLKIKLNGFYDKDPGDIFNLFESPMPYMNIEFIENRSGVLFSNGTRLNVSNGEMAFNLLLGYNSFQSGFLIPINDFNNLTQEANAQDVPPFMNATVSVQETSNEISFDFKQKSFFMEQETKCVYDKVSGLLTYTNTSFGNYTLEMTLINLPSFPSDAQSIPSFQVSIILGIITTTTLIYIIKTKKRK